MAKEFDIFVRRRLHECDLIVTSLTYRDGISVANRLLLESCIKEYTLVKAVAAETDIELATHIDQMLKTAYIILNRSNAGFLMDYLETSDGETLCTHDGRDIMSVYKYPAACMDIVADIGLSSSAFVELGNNAIDICCDDEIQATLNQYFKAEHGIELSATDLTAVIEKFAGYANSDMEITQAIYNTLKYALERFESSVSFDTSVLGEQGNKFLDIDSAMQLLTDVKNLCYRLTTGGSTTLELAALVLGTEIHFSFGRAFSNMAFNSKVTKNVLYKMEAPSVSVQLTHSATEFITQFMSLEDVAVEIAMAAEPILKRHRLLEEMDDGTLESYDDMSLEDLYYVIIEG